MTEVLIRCSGDDWHAGESRSAVASNLQSGSMRVIVAVDEITDELRRMVSYLNAHTMDELELLALELGYMNDGDVELLVPTVYGIEAVGAERDVNSTRWDEEQFWEHAAGVSSGDTLQAIKALHAWAVDHDARFYWGEGKHHPSMTAWIDIDTVESPIWTRHLADGDDTVLGLNLGWLTGRVPIEKLTVLAKDLRATPEARSPLNDIEQTNYRRRPSLRIAGSLSRAGGLNAFLGSFAQLVVE